MASAEALNVIGINEVQSIGRVKIREDLLWFAHTHMHKNNLKLYHVPDTSIEF